jgi:hypothetical protein
MEKRSHTLQANKPPKIKKKELMEKRNRLLQANKPP